MCLLRMIAFRPVEDGLPSPGGGDGHSEDVAAKKPEPPVTPVADSAGAVVQTELTRPVSASRGTIPEKTADADLPTPEAWPVFFERLGLVGITQTIALHCELIKVHDRTLEFVLDANNATLFQPRQVGAFALAFEQLLGESVEVLIEVGEVGAKTPFSRQEQLKLQRQQEAEQALRNDAQLAELLAEFDAHVVEGSVRPR
jgi:DNA polymerase-3 subunit gamma/tau